VQGSQAKIFPPTKWEHSSAALRLVKGTGQWKTEEENLI
jgi:hypothetical protein